MRHGWTATVCCKVRRMFAHSTRNWWWTAPPAAR
ncbi:trp operon leader peptide [Streptomyces sp. ST1015]|nr:trp operon leader peptide [Streptomyces sp. ST1015]